MDSDFTIRDAIARRYWVQAAIEELSTRYKEQGFQVAVEAAVDGGIADLLAKKDGLLEIVEVKSARWTRSEREAVTQLRNFAAHTPGATFKLMWVNPPEQVEVDVEGLEKTLSNIWTEVVQESPVAELATHVSFDAIGGFDLHSLRYSVNRLEVQGSGIASFEMQYGSDSDEGVTTSDSYPFTFHLILDSGLNVVDTLDWTVDTSSFSE